jgi:hypothetical protein
VIKLILEKFRRNLLWLTKLVKIALAVVHVQILAL